MVKAVAENRGWDHRAPPATCTWAVDRLAELFAGEELQGRFLSANALDQNSYEDDMPTATVADGLDEVEQFAAALESYLP